MAARAVIQVAGFTGVEIGCSIAAHLGIDITMLEVGIGVAFFAAIVIGRGHIINAGPRFKHSRKGVFG